MEFKIEVWPLENLLKMGPDQLNLSPPYQRNPIWTKTTQKILIQSIKDGHPIPNIFLFLKSPGCYEMVDGQQRTRAVKLYYTSEEINLGDNDLEFKNGAFLKFEIAVTTITKIEEDESIEDFYYMVNSSGVKVNRPETLKAQYFKTKFLELVESLTVNSNFQTLNIIPPASQKRMLDRDLVEELCALVLHGITDKKTQVDKMFESDVSEDEYKLCKSRFEKILDHFIRFNNIYAIKSTRYRQRNDFYTLFGFLKDNLNISEDILDYFYKLLLKLEVGIRPSRTACVPLAEYAFACVSQSNSSTARQTRQEIFNNLFLNQEFSPNSAQQEVKKYYPMEGEYFIQIGKYFTFNLEILSVAIDKKEASQL